MNSPKKIHKITGKILINNNLQKFEPDIIAELVLEKITKLISNFTNIEEELFKKNKIEVKLIKIIAEEYFQKDIFEIHFTINKKGDLFLNNLLKEINTDEILKTIDTRVDDNCNLFIRLDLNKFIEKDELLLTDSGNCIHLRIKIASYPSKKDKAIETIKTIINEIK